MDFKGRGRKAGVVSLELMQPGTCPFPRIAQTSSLTRKARHQIFPQALSQ